MGYELWRTIGVLGVDVVWQTARELQRGDAAARLFAAYGDEWLVCLPKGEGEAGPDGERVHTVAQPRPLSIVDTANRLIANASRLRWEPLLEPRLSGPSMGSWRERAATGGR